MITVMGATGNVGRKITERLLKAGEAVRAVGRNHQALDELADAGAEVVAGFGVNADAVAPDMAIPMIATRDVAEVAAGARVARDWTGFQTRELLGTVDLTFVDATRNLGEAMGQPDLAYVRLPDEEMAAALVQAGFSPDTASLQVAMGRAMSEGRIVCREDRSPANTTPTRFEDVVGGLLDPQQVGT